MDASTVCSKITDTLSFKKTVVIFKRKWSFFLHTNRFEMQSEIVLSTLFSNWPRRLNRFEKARFLENLCKKKTLEFGQHQQIKPD